MKGDERECIDAGCDDYLSKPIDRQQLYDKIRKYLPSDKKTMTENEEQMHRRVSIVIATAEYKYGAEKNRWRSLSHNILP